jgi:23S rRNA (guanosine2251-2'-O)-methyltransferase
MKETVFGVHPVTEVLRKGRRPCRVVLVGRSSKDAAVKEVLALARERGVEVRFVGKDEIEEKAPGGNHQGILVETEPLPIYAVEEALGSGDNRLWLGLDQITDPHNLGAILRNAACFGAGAVVITERRSAAPTPLVQKIASGAAEHVRIVDAGNLNQAIRKLKDRGYWVYGAAGEGKPLPMVRLNEPTFLIIGAEGTGIRRRTRELCDELVAIPQAPGAVSSLNASCASAVLLYWAARELGLGGGGG